ncbi:MAG: hypothetical protein ACTSVK_04310, partial [Promethearchaeota archaeon]
QMELITSTTVHDPEALLKPIILRNIDKTIKICKKIVVIATPTTNSEIISLLEKYSPNLIIKQNSSMKNVDNYKFALKIGIENISEEGRVFYSDFDRLLHWVENFSEELAHIIEENLDYDYLHLGRSQTAFKTHPSTQTRTEYIANQFASKILGFSTIKDIISVCWIAKPFLIKKVIENKSITNQGFYITWPIIMWLNAKIKEYIEVEGQEWETPDKYKEKIKEIGYKKWVNNFENSREWKRRLILLQECLDEAYELATICAKRNGSGIAENSDK